MRVTQVAGLTGGGEKKLLGKKFFLLTQIGLVPIMRQALQE